MGIVRDIADQQARAQQALEHLGRASASRAGFLDPEHFARGRERGHVVGVDGHGVVQMRGEREPGDLTREAGFPLQQLMKVER